MCSFLQTLFQEQSYLYIIMADQLAKLRQYENIQNFLFQIQESNFTNFDKMQQYLENCDKAIELRMGDLQTRMQILKDELVRTAGVYNLNNKKRQKQEQLLQIQREKIKKNLQAHKQRLNISIHPITLVLREKKNEITRLNQTKEIIEDFDRIMNGKEEEMLRTLPLDEKHFNNSALKIYVFKCLLEDMNNPTYNTAKSFIKRKFIDLKNKIISNFKEGFIKKDIIIINNILPYCEEYELLDEISDYYNEEAFKESQKIYKIEPDYVETEIKNMFFLLKRGFDYAFAPLLNGIQKNSYKISIILSKHNEFISRRLVTYVFQKILKQSIDNVLKNLQSSSDYLLALQLFCTQCKNILSYCEQIIDQQKIVHLIQTYIQSLFDTYLDGYLYKQLYCLEKMYKENVSCIVEQIKAIDALQEEQTHKKEAKKFSFKKLMDYKIETKKVYNVEYVREKLQALSSIFMDPSLQKLFERTKYTLNRNNKISKLNEVDKNRNEILGLFIKQLGQLINTIILCMKDVIPGFDDNAPPLEHQFFQVIPQIHILLQRMEYLYSEYKKQAKYQLSQSIKLQQKKEDLILVCEKNLNKIVADALACILSSQKSILRQKSNYLQAHQEGISNKIYMMLQKYVKSISRISQVNYRQSLLKTLGLQFVNLLIQHYSAITYNKDGLGLIYVDVGGFGKVLKLMRIPAIEERFKVFKSLIDIYVLKNDEKELNSYIKTEKEGPLATEKDDVIRLYVQNKQRVERNLH